MSDKSVRTITDIAKLAGVSKSTVSRALSDSSLISSETKERIQAIAKEHNFQINLPASRLSKMQSSTIAYVTHGYYKDYCIEDLFQMELLGAISRTLAVNNYDLLMVHVDPHNTDWISEYIDTGRVDGFILMTSTRKQTHIQTLIEIQVPFIVWGVPLPGQSYPSVTGDNTTGGRLATEHLLQIGKQRIAFIGGPKGDLEADYRFQGYEKALSNAGIALDPALIVYGDYSSPSGSKLAHKLIEQAPDLDSIFANSDLMAIGAINELLEMGYRVPDDIAVVGYDDLSLAQYSHPPLTTVRQNIPEAGRMLVTNLINYLETGIVTNVSIPVNLIVRKSTQAA